LKKLTSVNLDEEIFWAIEKERTRRCQSRLSLLTFIITEWVRNNLPHGKASDKKPEL